MISYYRVGHNTKQYKTLTQFGFLSQLEPKARLFTLDTSSKSVCSVEGWKRCITFHPLWQDYSVLSCLPPLSPHRGVGFRGLSVKHRGWSLSRSAFNVIVRPRGHLRWRGLKYLCSRVLLRETILLWLLVGLTLVSCPLFVTGDIFRS